jgi:hypothetical protein
MKRLGAEILDSPDGWYAVYFLGPDRLKFEVVRMPAAERRYKEMRRQFASEGARNSSASANTSEKSGRRGR